MSTGTEMIVEVQGERIPALGFGTWLVDPEDAAEATRDALEIGYRQIDTARAYGNEREVGEGIRQSGVSREEIWLTTKVWLEDAARHDVITAGEDSLRTIGVDYLDLLLLHWPNPEVALGETIEGFMRLQDQGKIRHFGLSNHPARMLREALEHGPVFADQVEYHPLLAQRELLELSAEHDLLITAYSPLAHGKVLENETLQRIGRAHGVSPGAVGLRWLLDQPRVSPIPKASSHDRREQNLREPQSFSLTDAERAEIDALPKNVRTADPDFAPDWD
jgi:2,5-diketo-D-gluconate reductase B